MFQKRNLVSLVGVGLLIVSLGSYAFAQSVPVPAEEKTTRESGARMSRDIANTRSAGWYEAQIQAQQAEMNELRGRIEKLEAVLQALTVHSQDRAAVSRRAYLGAGDGVTPDGDPTAVASASVPLNALSSNGEGSEVTPRELLPDIGHIGAQVGLFVGGAQNPFRANEGLVAGGYIDLPVKDLPGGKLSYEILAGLQRAKTTTQTTSGVIALVNNAISGNLFTPLPVTNRARERMTVLTVVPVAFKYTLTSLDRYRFRPYAVVGLGTYVTLSTQNIVDFDAAQFVGPGATADLLNALLRGPQVAGLAPIAPELRARGMAAGQGDFRFGVHFGGGAEFRMTPRTSIGFDLRFNKIEGRNGGTFTTFAPKLGVHF